MTGGRRAGQRQVLRPNVLHYERVRGDEREHNAAKPVAMLVEIIEAATDPGELVLDLFAGSGSTLIAADAVGRKARAVEVEPSWCDVIVDRWRRRTGGEATRA